MLSIFKGCHEPDSACAPVGAFSTLLMINFQFPNSSVIVLPSWETANFSSVTCEPFFFSISSTVRGSTILTLIVSDGCPLTGWSLPSAFTPTVGLHDVHL